MATLGELRRRYEGTPRALDEDLSALAIGERGCLGDAITVLGVVVIIGFGALMYLTGGGQGYVLIGAILFVTGFLLSTRAKAQSTGIKRRALSAGPLVLGKVVKGREDLWGSEPVMGPAVVVFSTAEARRFDAPFLEAVCARVKALDGAADVPAEQAEVARQITRELVEGVIRLPASLVEDAAPVFLATTIVDAHRLPQRRLTDGTLPLIVAPELGVVEHV
ncbi:MAG: hypothetical protein R3A51_13790 [Nannocystaceae bacterium]|nr:hypothetical protein [Myxococcales bacterium]